MVQHFNWQCWWWTSLLQRVSSRVQHYPLKIKRVIKSQQKISACKFQINRKKVLCHQSLDLSQSLSTHCCNEWCTQRAIYCSIPSNHPLSYNSLTHHQLKGLSYSQSSALSSSSLVSSVGTMSSLSKSTSSDSSSAGVMSF